MYPITFPNLNLELDIPKIAFQIGDRPIYWYGIIIVSGIILSLILAYRKLKKMPKTELDKKGLSWDIITDLVMCMLPTGIICARLYYCIFHWDYYADNLADVIKIWNRRSSDLWWNNWWNTCRFCIL